MSRIYTLTNNQGATAKITNLGGVVMSLCVPDKDGCLDDVVCGYDKVEDYEDSPYFGCLVGRFGNRIANGQFKLDGKTYSLAINNGEHHLHGGDKGFDKVEWLATEKWTEEGPSLILNYHSADGEEGYPGNLEVEAIYTLTHQNELKLDYRAVSDQDTFVSLTHHSYFNLAGHSAETILDHQVQIQADSFLPVNEGLIPTGEVASVKGTPFDFREPQKVGSRLYDPDEQLNYAKGYDHNWVIRESENELNHCARVFEEETGRVMDVYSNAPGMQFYTGNFLDGSNVGKGGVKYQHRQAFCMEPQHFPDAPNQTHFPSALLKRGEAYQHSIIYQFSCSK